MMRKKQIGAALLAGTMLLSAACVSAEPMTEVFQPELTENGEAVTEESDEAMAEGAVQMKRIRYAKDEKEIYDVLMKTRRNYGRGIQILEDEMVLYETSDAGVSASGAMTKSVTPESGNTDHSQVNTRDAKVDEADLIRTDGKYIYILSPDGSLRIVSAEGADSRPVAEYDCSFEETLHRGGISDYSADPYWEHEAREMFVDGDRLSILCTQSVSGYMTMAQMDETWRFMQETIVLTLDISDIENPKLLGSYHQDGAYLQARKVGDVIYLFSEAEPMLGDSLEESDLSVYAGGQRLEPESMVLPDTVTSRSYLVVSGIDTKEPAKTVDAKAFVSGADQFYATENSLYVMNTNRETCYESTELARFAWEDGRIEPVAATRLKGYVNDSFSIDEYDGHVRVLTTYFGSVGGAIKSMLADLVGLDYYDDDYWTRHNALFILDEQLGRVSSLQGIAKNEEIRSARFFGDTAYFVTYQNTDPLFAVDLSDPASPKLLGELSVTGFSSYLHPYGEGRLLGMGFESDPETGVVTGVKLSMFDVSDPGNVTEIDRTVIRGMTYCEAVSNYKMILADAGKNLIGFFGDNRYFVYSWTPEQGFVCELLYDLYTDGFNSSDYRYESQVRGLYSGEHLYVAGTEFVAAFDLADGFKKEAALSLVE
ncbi:MAG: beta-propeller domain-containing protein [Lachnospiraceae bacterium]|nr:beta-propeller domain-containing protein [Lachnospiraceae bacterium]